MAHDELLVPGGTRLLHIGPPKTGTTAIQGALMQAREAMAAHGVVYPGDGRNHWDASLSVVGNGDSDARRYEPMAWESLVRVVADAGDQRVVVSSEAFAGAGVGRIRSIVDSLGGPRVHVVLTLRTLVKVLPSWWQHAVRNRALSEPYEEWLTRLLDPRVEPKSLSFWRRHGHDEVVDRWASVVGRRNITVVMVDESNYRVLMQAFERLLGLPTGLLKPDGVTNSSLAFGEIEAVRILNEEFQRRGWSLRLHQRLVRHGAVANLVRSNTPVAPSQRIGMPAWAAERAASIGGEAAEKISASGVRIVGDITALGRLPDGYDSVPDPPAEVPSEAVARAVVGTILAAERTS